MAKQANTPPKSGIFRALMASLFAAMIPGCTGYYEGPPSDHFDGEIFFNPDKPRSRGKFDFWKWQFTREKAKWPNAVPLPSHDRPPERVTDGSLRISFVGHVAILLQVDGVNILLDPIWSDRASPFSWIGPKRVTDPGVAFEDLPPVDLVLISHNHYDHLDIPTIERLREAHDPEFIVPLGNDVIIHHEVPEARVRTLDWHQGLEAAGLKITLGPMHHWSARAMDDRNKALWGAYVIETAKGPIYFVGDSGYGGGDYFRDAAERHGPFRLAILPFGAYEPRWFMTYAHMNPDDAVRAHIDLGRPTTLGTHWGTFQLTDEARLEPVSNLEAARKEHAVPDEKFRALAPGEVWMIE